MNQDWELHFAAKSRRRSRARVKIKLLKITVLALLGANVAMVIYMRIVGY